MKIHNSLADTMTFRELVSAMLRRVLELAWFHVPGADMDALIGIEGLRRLVLAGDDKPALPVVGIALIGIEGLRLGEATMDRSPSLQPRRGNSPSFSPTPTRKAPNCPDRY